MMRCGVRTTVKVRIKAEVLTTRKRTRLEQITGRDTRIIKHYLRVIYHNEEQLVIQKKKVNKSKLDQLTLTTNIRSKRPKRLTVRHDLKKIFPRCSQNEFQECREKAVAIYHSQQSKNSAPAKESAAKKSLALNYYIGKDLSLLVLHPIPLPDGG